MLILFASVLIRNAQACLASRESPKALGAPREEQVVLVDFASSSQALVKVRVRVSSIVFVDYLTYHQIDGAWLITAKGYHIERDHAAERR